MKKTIWIITILIISALTFLSAKNSEKVLLCDFETEEHMGCFASSEGLKGETKIVHDAEKVKEGKGAYEMTWDFTQAKEGFLNFDFYKKTDGIIKSVSFWLYADENSKNASLNIWTRDISGEFYFAPVTIKEAGWNYITSKVSQSVPWASG
ncbi:MAG: hypothetical protein KBT47_02280, partial [Armatimonadetes bacterium]|nr:hypothetical protein [Candidatus Hippobium faecium]